MSLLLWALAVFLACIPQLIAQPTSHLDLHRRHRHHARAHHHAANVDKISTQLPIADPKPVLSKPSFIRSDALVSLYFTSVPQWPKSGEQENFVTVPLGTWIEPGNWSFFFNSASIAKHKQIVILIFLADQSKRKSLMCTIVLILKAFRDRLKQQSISYATCTHFRLILT